MPTARPTTVTTRAERFWAVAPASLIDQRLLNFDSRLGGERQR